MTAYQWGGARQSSSPMSYPTVLALASVCRAPTLEGQVAGRSFATTRSAGGKEEIWVIGCARPHIEGNDISGTLQAGVLITGGGSEPDGPGQRHPRSRT